MNMQNKPSQEFIDYHMTQTVESVMIHAFSTSKGGALPNKAELVSFVRLMPAKEIVALVRSHTSTRSLQVQLKDDNEILRWAEAVAAS
jgi:hypothetical protein